MSQVIIEDIEAVDDYWWPTICSILEGDNKESMSKELEQRIRSHDKDIERICNFAYQGFIDSIQELLQVRTQAHQLATEVQTSDQSLQQISSSLIQRSDDLVKARQIESNLASTIEALNECLPALECYIKSCQQASNKKQYYQSLKTLETLEVHHLPKLQSYKFVTQMRHAIPVIKENIRSSSESDFRDFLQKLRTLSSKIGQEALEHTKKCQKLNINTIIEDHKKFLKSHDNPNTADYDYSPFNCCLMADDNTASYDFSPIYRCLHIYTVLGQREYFEKVYRQQRSDQSKLVLQPPPGMHNNLEAYERYICDVVGFFVVEDHIKHTAGDVVTTSYLEELWSTSSTKLVTEIGVSSSSCTDPDILLGIKNLVMLALNTLKSYGYTVNVLWKLVQNMKDHYNEVLLQYWIHVFHDILDKEQFLPMVVENQEEFEAIIERFPFHSEQLENAPFPKKFPFSHMVPEVYHQAKVFMYACMKFAEDLALCPGEMAAMLRMQTNLLLSLSLSDCLSVVFHNPSVALPELIQIITDTQYLEKASPLLDEFVSHMTNTLGCIIQPPLTMFHVTRQEAEKQIGIRLTNKIDEFFESAIYDWLLVEPPGKASAFITDMIAYLSNTFESFASKLPSMAQTACHRTCEHVAEKIWSVLFDDDVKQISNGALHQINLDLLQCEFFAAKDLVPGLREGELSKYFLKCRQLLDLLTMEEWATYLHDYGTKEGRYNLVHPQAVIIILEKMGEAGKKTKLSGLWKNDKKKMLEKVLKQLENLIERQN